jgi:hypothetical protein
MNKAMKVLRGITLLLCGASIVFGQTPPASVEGVVIEYGTTNPLARVTLDLRAADNPSARYPAITTREGKFSFRNVLPGRYSLAASRNGYLRVEYGQRGPNGTPAVLEVRAGQSVRDIRLAMLPGAAISGRVYDNKGEPAVNAQMHAWKITYAEGWRKLVPVTSQVTNDLGEYRLFGLPPGQYYVSAQPEPQSFVRSPAYVSLTPPLPGILLTSNTAGGSGGIPDPANALIQGANFAPIYLGGATSEFSAKPVTVRPGDDVRGMDIPFERIPMVSLTGSVIDGVTREPVRAALTVTPLAPNVSFTALTTINVTGGVLSVTPSPSLFAQGQFRTGVLPHGSYLLTAIVDGPGGRLAGQAIADTRNVDPAGVRISVAPGFEVAGQVVFEGTPAIRDLKISLRSTASQPLDVAAVPVSADGSFVLRGVAPGEYVVQTSALGAAYVKSGLEEALRLDRAPEGRLEIVIAGNPGRVTGSVSGGGTVVLVPEQRNRFDLYRSAVTDAAGQYRVDNVAPGRYKVFAWEDVEKNAWWDAGFMAMVEDRGVGVAVDAGGSPAVAVMAIPLR